jgi:AcrR family transcriptional regulator
MAVGRKPAKSATRAGGAPSKRPARDGRAHAPRSPAPRPRTAWTRDRLLSEALTILREEGSAAVNTVRLSRAAGIAQSGFYRYFSTIDACLEAAIEPLARGYREDVARRRRVWFATGLQA